MSRAFDFCEMSWKPFGHFDIALYGKRCTYKLRFVRQSRSVFFVPTRTLFLVVLLFLTNSSKARLTAKVMLARAVRTASIVHVVSLPLLIASEFYLLGHQRTTVFNEFALK